MQSGRQNVRRATVEEDLRRQNKREKRKRKRKAAKVSRYASSGSFFLRHERRWKKAQLTNEPLARKERSERAIRLVYGSEVAEELT